MPATESACQRLLPLAGLLLGALLAAPAALAGSTQMLDATLPEAIDAPGAAWTGEAAYVFGGAVESMAQPRTDAIVRVDPALGTVETMDATLPSPREDLGAAWTGEHVYLFGGYGCAPNARGVEACDEILRYDPASDALETLDASLADRDRPVAVWTGEHVYLVGQRHPDIHRFDPDTGELTTHADVLQGWQEGGSAVWTGSSLLIFPATDHEILRFDPDMGTVESTGERLPSPRDQAATVWTGEAAFVLGGDAQDGGVLDEIVRYDPATDTAETRPVALPDGGDASMPAVWNGSAALLIAYGTEGAYAEGVLAYDPSNAAPEARFGTEIDGRTVAFDATGSIDGDGEITSYTWTFGDGARGSEAIVEHTYDEAGTYEVTLTVEDDEGARSTVTEPVTFANQPPIAPIAVHVENHTVHVSATDAIDPDGGIASYTWTFGEGDQAQGVTAEHTYGARGNRTIELVVEDDEGARSTNTTEVLIGNHAPIPRITGRTGNLTLNVSAADAGDPDGEIASYAWRFDDGHQASGPTAEHTFAGHGEHTVELTVTDDEGATASTARTFDLANQPPDIQVEIDTQERTVRADVRASIDPDGTIVQRRIDWGDGHTSRGPAAEHVYRFDGRYTLTVTLVDDDGAEATKRVPVEVAQADQPPVAAVDVVTDGLSVTLDGAGARDPEGSIAAYRWDLGDGTERTGPAIEHRYAAEGAYVITLTVTDEAGHTDDARRVVYVSEESDPSRRSAASGSSVGISLETDGRQVLAHMDPFPASPGDASYRWTWGDGADPAEGAQASHTYAEAGRYRVTLTVTEPDGTERSASKQVHIWPEQASQPRNDAAFAGQPTSSEEAPAGDQASPEAKEPPLGLAWLGAVLVSAVLASARRNRS